MFVMVDQTVQESSGSSKKMQKQVEMTNDEPRKASARYCAANRSRGAVVVTGI
jgi:hypothetical protein